jgi:hypothetical protein
LGVLIGWLLTSLTGFLKNVYDKKKILGKSLMQLDYLRFEQKKLFWYFDYLKEKFGINSQYEKMRFRGMQRYVLNNDNFKISIETINELATVYPLTAMQLKLLIENYSFSKKMTLSESASSSDIYVKLLSMFEVALEIEHNQLEKIIFKVAWGHSFKTWIQIKWKYYNMDKRILHPELTKYFDEELQN